MSERPADPGVATGSRSGRGAPTGRDLLDRLAGEPCTLPECGGTLERRPYKGTDAVVCGDCGVPPVRVWDDA